MIPKIEYNDDYETYPQLQKRMRRYLREHPGLRQIIEDLWRPDQIQTIKGLLNDIDVLGEFGPPNRRKQSHLQYQLSILLQRAPLDDFPDNSADLDIMITIVNSERSVRSRKKILGEMVEQSQGR